MELTYSNEQIPPFTNQKKAEETKLPSLESNLLSPKKIQLLPEHLIDQIKAGEVIERPSALLKELIENSIDAGSNKIEIRISKSGLDLISVTDNGRGIDVEDLPLAFTRHATSKIERYDDLFHLGSYGFRGEALASASSISRIVCWSSPASEFSRGGKIEIHGGKIISHINLPVKKSGTSIQVRDLFFNTPARLQFIRSLQSEKNSMIKVLQAFIISNPSIAFQIYWEEEGKETEKEIYPAADNFAARAKMLLSGPEHELYFSTYQHQGHSIQAVIRAKSTKSTHKLQILSANRRLFFDKSLHQILIKTMTAHWPLGTTGEYIINLEIPPNKIDVNVHPNKTQLKFLDQHIVSALVRYVAQDVCQQINDNMPVPNTSPGPSTSDHSQSELSQNKLESLVIDQNKMPLGWSFYHHSEHGLLLIDESWLILYWWKLHYKNKSDQVPLLIGIPIELSDLNYQNFESWRIIFSDLSLDIHLSEKKQLIIRAVPQAMNDLNIYTMLTPLLAFTANEIKNYLECDILPEVLHPSNKPLPKNHLDYLIKKCFKGEQIRGPIRTWHSLESWWRQQ